MEVGEVSKGIRWSAKAGGPPKVPIGGVSGRGRGPTIKRHLLLWDPGLVTGLLRTQKQHNAIWVIVDRLTKSAHFLLVSNDDPLDKLSQLCVEEIVRLHGVPLSIVSD